MDVRDDAQEWDLLFTQVLLVTQASLNDVLIRETVDIFEVRNREISCEVDSECDGPRVRELVDIFDVCRRA